MKILGIEVKPAKPEEIKKQRENFVNGPRGPRETYATQDGVKPSLDHLRDEVRRINELGK